MLSGRRSAERDLELGCDAKKEAALPDRTPPTAEEFYANKERFSDWGDDGQPGTLLNEFDHLTVRNARATNHSAAVWP